MNFEYKIVYDTPYLYNGVSYSFDPSLPVPVPQDDPDYGRTLQEVTGMTDEEAAAIVLAAKWTQIRTYRDKLLKETDWVSGEDVPQAIKDAWFPYRQALRDITTTTNPDDVVWPTQP